MLYMVVETFTKGPQPVYERAVKLGRRLPPGLTYVDSWVDHESLGRCFQLMETEDPRLFELWTSNWTDLVKFEIVEVISSAEAASAALKRG